MALYSGHDFDTREYNDATESAVPAGQIFNPLTAAGIVTAHREALTGSGINQASTVPNDAAFKAEAPAIRAAVIRMGVSAHTLGLSSTTALYSGEVDPHVLDIADAYATLASGGLHTTPHLLAEVSDAHSVLYRAKAAPTQAFARKPIGSNLLCEMAAGPATTAWQTLVRDPEPEPVRSKTAALPVTPLKRTDCGVTGESLSDDSAWAVAADGRLATAIAVFRDGPGLKFDGKSRSLKGVAGRTAITGDGLPARTLQAFLSTERP
ncbi:hypothetical protein [Streptacidiphilus sp. PAMC 29251]